MNSPTLLDAIIALTKAIEANTAALIDGKGTPAPAPAPASAPAPAPVAPPSPAPAEATIEQAVARAKAYAAEHGVEKLKAVLQSFGVSAVSKLPPEAVPAFLARLV